MAKARLTGVVTRLVPADEASGRAAKVYFAPNDRGACRWIDGRHQTASGELHLYGDVEGYAVGGGCEIEYDPEDPARAPKLVRPAPAAPAPAPVPASDDEPPVG